MQMKKKLLAVLLILTCLCLTGCAVLEENLLKIVADQTEKAGTDVLAAQFVDALIANDADAALSAMCSDVTMVQLLSAFPQVCAMLPDTDEYTLVPTYFSTKTENDITTINVVFTLTMGEQFFNLTTRQITGQEGLTNVHLQPMDADAVLPAATGKSNGLDAADIVICLLRLACAAIMLWAMVDCERHKVKRKWLWMLLILLGDVTLTILGADGKLGLQLLFTPALPEFSFVQTVQGGFTLQVGCPIGPLVYLLCRRKLIAPPTDSTEAMPSEVSSDSEAENE